MPEFAVTAVGRDRPGIVAAISEALLELQGNIEDSQMSILRGHFAVMLMLDAPAGLDEPALRADLERVRTTVPLETVSLTEVPALDALSAQASHSISVYGADHPGIVHGVARALSDAGVNVVGMSTRVVGGAANDPLYVMLLEVTLPDTLGEAALETLLAAVAEEQGVDLSVRPVDGDVL
jgi:glycine cleavage system transcriptional repressor